MYQWVNAHTGSSQLSGKPPAWYRTSEGGPRVLVFDKNRLVDDTSVSVEESQRLKLRRDAFELSTEQQKKGLTSREAIAKLEEQIKALVESPAMEDYLNTPEGEDELDVDVTPDITVDPKPEALVEQETPDERVERLKTLISRWDERRTKEAKSLLKEPESSKENKEKDKPLNSTTKNVSDTPAQ